MSFSKEDRQMLTGRDDLLSLDGKEEEEKEIPVDEKTADEQERNEARLAGRKYYASAKREHGCCWGASVREVDNNAMLCECDCLETARDIALAMGKGQ